MGKPPSRERYEERTTVKSFRISTEKAERLDEMLDTLDMTKREWLEGVIDDVETDYNRARDKGREEGYQNGKKVFKIEIPCSICGDPIIILDNEALKDDVHDHLDNCNSWTGRCFRCISAMEREQPDWRYLDKVRRG